VQFTATVTEVPVGTASLHGTVAFADKEFPGCYPYRAGGKSKSSTWMNKAIQNVLNYDKANLL
jgi:hypothetical protein